VEKIGHKRFHGQPPVTIVGGNEDRLPLIELRHHRQCLGRQGYAGEDVAAVALDHLLGFAHRSAGLPLVSSINNWICRPVSSPLEFWVLAHSSPPRFSCWPTEPSGPVSASGIPILIGSAAKAQRGHRGAAARTTPPTADLVTRFAELTIIAARPAWPWQSEMIAVLLHKPNVWYELHGWSPKYFTDELKREIPRRLAERVMFAADYPLFRYERLFADWLGLGYSEQVLQQIFRRNAERLLAGLGR